MHIFRTSDYEGAAVGQGHRSVHEVVQHRGTFKILAERQRLIRNALGHSVGALLDKCAVGVGTNNQGGRLLLLLHRGHLGS